MGDKHRMSDAKAAGPLLRGEANKLVLVGFKGCGKSTVGAALARILEAPFVDIDRRIEKNHEAECGENLSCREIFKKHGELYFRRLERKILERVLRSREPAVVALGGGSVECSKELLADGSGLAVVFIYARPKVLFSRIISGGIPPFFDREDPAGSFKKLYRKRLKRYKDVALFTVDNSSRPPEEVASEIIALLEGGRPGGSIARPGEE